MGTTPSFTPIYKKNEKDKKVKIGISFNGQLHLGINHPSEVKTRDKPTIQYAPKKHYTAKKKSRLKKRLRY